jgi:hypothetical protein
MIKVRLDYEQGGLNRHIILLGLSHENLERLRARQSIRFDLSELEPPLTGEVFIFAGEDEQRIQRELEWRFGQPLHTTTRH